MTINLLIRLLAILPFSSYLFGQWYSTSALSPVYAGGLTSASWANNVAVSDTSLGAGSGGVTVLLAGYSQATMFQDGAVKQVKMSVNADAGGSWQLKCYSTDWAGNYTYIGQSSTFTVGGTGTQTVTVSLPTCPVFSVLGIFVPHGSAIWAHSTALISAPWEAGNVTTFSAGGTATSTGIDLQVLGDPPFVVCAGDSICAGHDAYEPPWEGHQSGYNIASQTVYQTQQAISSSFLYQNYGLGSTTCDYVDSIMPTLNLVLAKALYLHCGVNDLGTGIGWTTGGTTGNGTQGALNGILSQLPAGVHLFLDEVLPGSSNSNASVLALNANFAIWAAANGATIVHTHDAMGCPSGGNTMCSAYGGGLHPNVAGYTALGGILASTLQTYYSPTLSYYSGTLQGTLQ